MWILKRFFPRGKTCNLSDRCYLFIIAGERLDVLVEVLHEILLWHIFRPGKKTRRRELKVFFFSAGGKYSYTIMYVLLERFFKTTRVRIPKAMTVGAFFILLLWLAGNMDYLLAAKRSREGGRKELGKAANDDGILLTLPLLLLRHLL